MAAEKTHYLGYHMVYECQEGFDIPMTALERRHHRTRQRPDAKPTLHGAHLTSRRHGKAHVLGRHHSWCGPGDEPEEELSPGTSSEEANENTGTGATVSTVASLLADDNSNSWPPLAEGITHPPADASKVGNFAEHLLTNLGACDGPQAWPKLKKEPEQQAPAPRPPREVGAGAVEPGVAEAAAAALPQLVEEYLSEFDGEIAFGQMVGLLKFAVDRERAQRRPAASAEAAAGEGAVSSMPENLEGHWDLRGKGWTRQHKASHNFKTYQALAEKQEKVWERYHQYYGLPAEMFEPGQSWRSYDKRRSKQHGGQLRFRRSPAGWVEE